MNVQRVIADIIMHIMQINQILYSVVFNNALHLLFVIIQKQINVCNKNHIYSSVPQCIYSCVRLVPVLSGRCS